MQMPLMAQAVAAAINATKRQVQLWTDAGVVHCIPSTDRQGTGRQRHYERDEIPIAALVAEMARFRLPLGMLKFLSETIRMLLAGGDPPVSEDWPEITRGRPASWYRDALAGKFQSFIILPPNRRSISWSDRETVEKVLDGGGSVFIIAVQQVARRVARKLNT